MCDVLVMYFRMNGEKIEILLINGAQQCASNIFIVTEIKKSQLGVGLRTRSQSLCQKEDSDSGQNPDSGDSDSTPLTNRRAKDDHNKCS